MNGFGVSGVAPKSTIVEVRAGQDSGFFFASPTVNALTYSGDAGLDVVNMSFYVDPWLYNCRGGAPEADFSNWTTEPWSGEVEVSAPGGFFRDGVGTPSYRTSGNLILSTYPLGVLQASKEVDEFGDITPAGVASGVIKQCQAKPAKGTTACGYYAWLQGTSMAAPHATGVAALAVAAHGRAQPGGGYGLDPDAVQRLMLGTARNHACPAGGVQSYANEGRDASYTARCVGSARLNGFHGEGIVNALGVVR